MAPGGLGTPKIDHKPYMRTNFFPVSSYSIGIGPFFTHFWVRGVGGPMYAIVYPDPGLHPVVCPSRGVPAVLQGPGRRRDGWRARGRCRGDPTILTNMSNMGGTS